MGFRGRQESGRVYPDSGRGGIDGNPPVPGPYVCAEWEFGGYPWWLQNIPGMEIRRDNPEFLKRTKLYIDKLYEQVGDLQVSKGGPIIMVQAENEFGSYVAQRKDIPLEEHRRYNAKIKRQLADAGFNVPLFTSDGSWLFEGGSTPGALPTANGESNVENLKKVVNEYHGGVGPYMVAEFYPGWLMHWAGTIPRYKRFRHSEADGDVPPKRCLFQFLYGSWRYEFRFHQWRQLRQEA